MIGLRHNRLVAERGCAGFIIYQSPYKWMILTSAMVIRKMGKGFSWVRT